ncbi:hypothetical protein QJQ45_010724 [Haematococcus lacustris]|nr:hypothetical protein QJQ45_010724 [Haematococcus lacustris]
MSAAAATEAELDEARSQQPSVSMGYVSTCWGHKRPRSCLGRVAQQQVTLDRQQLQGAQHQLIMDQQQLQGAQHQLAVDQQQLQDAQQQLAQALKQMQNGRTGLERSELLLRQHMDACMSPAALPLSPAGTARVDKIAMRHAKQQLSAVEAAGCRVMTLEHSYAQAAADPETLQRRAPHIASAHMTLNVHLLKEYARECLGWKGKRLTQKKPLLRADILEHLRWEQEMEEDQLAEVGVDEADEM